MDSINLSDTVWVQLTPRGEELFQNSLRSGERVFGLDFAVRALACYRRPDGWYEFSLGSLIRDFSPICHDGGQSPFKNNKIYLEKPF